MKNKKDRAWIEINLSRLKHNVEIINNAMPAKTKIMAVVKANATGHGSILVAKELEHLGITDFAVASLEEAIELRENGIKGNILIFGFTSFENLEDVIKYDLMQTIIDYSYSEKIKQLGLSKKLKCHVKINTGMNRLGENHDNIENLTRIYENDKLDIRGTFSHFCVADSEKEEHVKFSKLQIENFNRCIEVLQGKGFDLGKIHLQASYGLTNYPELEYDFVRMGIFLYGVDSSLGAYQKNRLDLKPILSLKARISSIKEISEGESVSYGRVYKAPSTRKVAAISIGYADGFPRSLVDNDMYVKINGQFAKIIGSICMDQTMIDVTDIENVSIGDEVVFIDAEDEKFSALNMATKSGNIVTEFLSRLGARLPRIGFYDDKKDESI